MANSLENRRLTGACTLASLHEIVTRRQDKSYTIHSSKSMYFMLMTQSKRVETGILGDYSPVFVYGRMNDESFQILWL